MSAFDPNLLEIIDADFHRNGVSGVAFQAALVDDPNDGDVKLVIMFPTEGHTAVLSLDKLMAEDIKFGSNSYRGDKYEEALRGELFDEEEESASSSRPALPEGAKEGDVVTHVFLKGAWEELKPLPKLSGAGGGSYTTTSTGGTGATWTTSYSTK